METGEIKYGHTGQIGKDGLLTTEQHNRLNKIQKNAAEKCVSYLDKMQAGNPFPLVAMATGIGKGNIIHRVIEKQVRSKPDSKILLISGTKLTLNKQTHESLARYQSAQNEEFKYVESENEEVNETELGNRNNDLGENPLQDEKKSVMYRTGKLGDLNANVRVATIQTVQSKLNNRNLDPQDYDLLIVDEVHNIGTPKRKTVIDQFKKIVGFTATPYRHSGKLKNPDEYGFKVVESLTLPEAQELRLLPPLVGMQIDTKSLVDEIPTTMAGIIDYKKLEKVLKESPELRPHIADKVAEIIQGKDYKTVIAVNFVWEAQELAELLYKKGIKVGIAVNQQATKAIHTEEIPAENTIERYKLPHENDQAIQVLISPYVTSEGFDAPTTEVLVWASPTDSELRYTQYTGRLARRAEGKRFGVVVDCLYQTSQYNWSYNMGMWMKGEVKQLDNGLLWLGPAIDIESLKKLPQVEALTKTSDRKPLGDLQKEGLLEIQETDFPIIQTTLNSTFIGTSGKLNSVVRKILKENSEIKIVYRRNKSWVVKVIADEKSLEYFKQKVQEAGVKLRDDSIMEVQENDFPLTVNYFKSIFIGDPTKIYNTIIEKILGENLEINTISRRAGGTIVKVIADEKSRELFMQKIQEAGVKLKVQNILEVQEDDFLIGARDLNLIFIGDSAKLHKLAVEKILRENPEIEMISRKVGNHTIKVITNEKSFELFKQKMQEAGAKLRDKNILEVQKGDLLITHAYLTSIFVGNSVKLASTAEKILKENPEIEIIYRKSGTTIVKVIVGEKPLEIFMQKMRAKQIILKDENILNTQEGDFPINKVALPSIFIGHAEKLSPVAEKILEENPEIETTNRKAGDNIIKVITNEKSFEIFKQKMQEVGVRLRDNLSEIQKDDIPITSIFLTSTFFGSYASLNKMMNRIIEENPEIKAANRKNRSAITRVITDKDSYELLKQKMQEAGARLKPSEK